MAKKTSECWEELNACIPAFEPFPDACEITREDWLNGAKVPTNNFIVIPADADLRELIFVSFEEIG